MGEASRDSAPLDHEPEEQRFAVWSGAYSSGAVCLGAAVRSEDVGERVEYRPGRAGLEGIVDRLGSPSRLHELLFSKNGQVLGSRRLAQSYLVGQNRHGHFSFGQETQDVKPFGIAHGRQKVCFVIEGVGISGGCDCG